MATPVPQIGAILTLAKESGADRKACKAALIEAGCDYEAALAALTKQTGRASAQIAVDESSSLGSSVTVLSLEPGDGVTYPCRGDKLEIHYRGTLVETGQEFDSSYARGKPFSFTVGVGEVIKGWDEGVLKLSEGEKAILEVSPDKAYGEQGAAGGKIPPNSPLKFEVWLLKVKRAPQNRDTLHASEYKNAAKALLGQ
ncbi:hypothetical protein AB1Y20_007442 [Prymnesium parvum]|uniref:peptidylprolyl isomerase n=1 Tax=Prymnesium parvum TaxID=97485 RepID=A0AB34IX28_PRYPA|mmetsp:Transcript_34782/g.86516  ORF Transcript_34782/g.86516 Transcript_34782/m.86516 type:complete len:198 (-) Transcript_34782:214-807(-)